MLTNQHRFAKRILTCSTRRDYQRHMCGLCHALGDRYGMAMRLLTNHEMILLNLLIEAQCEATSAIVTRRCPLNPRIRVETNQSDASKFAGAMSVMLTSASVEDDITDGRHLSLIPRLLKLLLSRSRHAAMQVLHTSDFDVQHFDRLKVAQANLEQCRNGDATAPTADMTARIFSMTARLANSTHNEGLLSVIGANYGAYLYLLDAFRDFPEDIEQRQFTPLRRFQKQHDGHLMISHEGVSWLLGHFESIAQNINTYVRQLKLYRFQDTIIQLLCDPIDRMVARLQQTVTAGDGVHFTQWSGRDMLKTALFLTPSSLNGTQTLPVEHYFQEIYEGEYGESLKNRERASREYALDEEPDAPDDDDEKSPAGGPEDGYDSTPDFLYRCSRCTPNDCSGSDCSGDGCGGDGGGDGCGGDGCGGDGCDGADCCDVDCG